MPEIPIAATGVLREFAEAGMLVPIDFHLARRLGQLAGEERPDVLLALALATRELRLGSVCVDLATAPSVLKPEGEHDDGALGPEAPLPWPEAEQWLADVGASSAVGGPGGEPRPFRLDGTLLYLDKYWREEQRLAEALRARSALPPLDTLPEAPKREIGPELDETQLEAVRSALNLPTVVITGGPGTGKTTIVSHILWALERDARLRVALAAPTGRAAGRLGQAVNEGSGERRYEATTLHKLLGARPRSSRVEFGPGNPLPYDVVVVDETSMVSLEMMGQLLSAVAPTTRLILLGDPHQLRSVEAGAVLADIERADDLLTAPGGAIVRLSHNHRAEYEEINSLAKAILEGDADAALRVIEAADHLALIDFDGNADPMSLEPLASDVIDAVGRVREAADQGDGAEANKELSSHRVLCGHREGPYGVGHWARSTRAALALEFEAYGFESAPYLGQPVLIQRTTDLLSNGDTGVVARHDGRLMAALDLPSGIRWLDPQLLDDAADLHAMTIHKSQGSQFGVVSVVLPPVGSPLLTRELLYTAVTRARHGVRLYGSPEALSMAIATPVRRASGL